MAVLSSGAPSAARPLEGRHVLITGAGGGIGCAIAQTLAAQGAWLSLAGRNRAALAALAERLGAQTRCTVVTLDITDADAVAQGMASARAALGPLAMLVNNAGQAESAPFGSTSLALWQRMLEVNLTGTFLCIQAALPDLLLAANARIVNIASSAGQRGYAYVAAYSAAKHGVIGLTRSLALELAHKDVTVNAVCPGYTETALLHESIERVVAKTGRSAEQARAALTQSNPQRRLVQPQEVADAVQWLCSAAAASVTGQAISVSGGEVM